MKEYHPTGVVLSRDGTRVKMLLRGTSGSMGFKAKETLKQVSHVVSWDEFCCLVKQGSVQLFVDKGNGPTVEYSPEEIKALQKISKKINTDVADELYWKSEMTFWDDCFDDPSGLSICLVCCRMIPIIKEVMVQGAFYMANPTDAVISTLSKNALVCKHHNGGVWMCNWSVSQLETILRMYDGPCSVNTNSMRCFDNTMYAAKMPGFSALPVWKITEVADLLEHVARENPNNHKSGTTSAGGVQRMQLS